MNKKSTIIIGTVSGVVILCLIGVIVILLGMLFKREGNAIPESTPVISNEEGSNDESEVTVNAVPDKTERLCYLGDYTACEDISAGKYTGQVLGLQDVFSDASTNELYSIEQLLKSYVSEVYNLNKDLPKIYVGEKDWKFMDSSNNPGQIVLYENKLYLFYYGNEVEEQDPVIKAGFPATSYGYIQPPKDNYKDNELCEDLPQDEAFRVLSALTDGECFSSTDEFYLIHVNRFDLYHYFPDDMEVTAYKVNANLGDTFVEIYLTNDRYYTYRTVRETYEEILDKYLYRNYADIQEEDSSEEDSVIYGLSDFNPTAIADYKWDEIERDVWDSVTIVKDVKIQQILQYALEEHGETSCESIREASYINGYEINGEKPFMVYLTATESDTPDYYISVMKSLGMAFVIPSDAEPYY